jgi:hypothetical protein
VTSSASLRRWPMMGILRYVTQRTCLSAQSNPTENMEDSLLSTNACLRRSGPYIGVLEAQPSNRRLAKAKLPGEGRSFHIGRAVWRKKPFPGSVCRAGSDPASPSSRGLEKILTYKVKREWRHLFPPRASAPHTPPVDPWVAGRFCLTPFPKSIRDSARFATLQSCEIYQRRVGPGRLNATADTTPVMKLTSMRITIISTSMAFCLSPSVSLPSHPEGLSSFDAATHCHGVLLEKEEEGLATSAGLPLVVYVQ